MSTYEDYNRASRLYDSQRRAVGADVMAAMLQFYTGKALKDLKILDAGCGTGNYAKALIDMGAKQITLLDASSKMLDEAKCKLSDYIVKGIIKDIIDTDMPPIPLPANNFDAVLFNVVLNHLDRDDYTFPKSVATLKETLRILRPQGLIVISTMLDTAASRVLWFTQLNMTLTKRFIEAIVPSVEQFEQMFHDAGITCIQKLNILGADIYQSYYNLDGPLDEKWRGTSSYWSFATREEIDAVEERIKDLKAKGEFEKWVKEHDHSRDTGILTIFFCKPVETEAKLSYF